MRPATALPSVDGDDALAIEASSAAQRIAAALPDADMQGRFAAADSIRILTRLAAPTSTLSV
jgi:hypothetical protein